MNTAIDALPKSQSDAGSETDLVTFIVLEIPGFNVIYSSTGSERRRDY